jgi:hypothetical protein
MYHPVDVDGRRLILLASKPGCFAVGFRVITAGWLSQDGERLILLDSSNRELMVITDEHLAQMLPVVPGNKILECSGYDFFIVVNSDDKS